MHSLESNACEDRRGITLELLYFCSAVIAQEKSLVRQGVQDQGLRSLAPERLDPSPRNPDSSSKRACTQR
jgi:hypothetical protein